MFREEEGKESGASIPQENLHVVRNIFMVNQAHRENLVRKTFMVNQSQYVGAESHSGMELKTTEKSTRTKFFSVT